MEGEARATKNEPESRRNSKLRLVKRLYERGWSAAEVRHLFRVVDWLMDLPAELQQGFREDLHRFEEERRMPYVTSIERLAKEEGRQEGARTELLTNIRAILKDKFGSSGSRLMRKIDSINDLAQLRKLTRALAQASSLQEFRDQLD